MLPLAYHEGNAERTAEWIRLAWDAVMDVKRNEVVKNPPHVIPAPAARNDNAPDFGDLNLKQVVQTKVIHLLGLVHDWEEPIDCAEVVRLARANNYAGMPEPLRPKTPGFRVSYEMSLVIDKKANGKTDVLKWIEFSRAQFVYQVKDHLVYGEALQPDWCKDVHRTKRVLQYLMERMRQ